MDCVRPSLPTKFHTVTVQRPLWRDEKVLKALRDAEASGATSPRSILDATQAVEKIRGSEEVDGTETDGHPSLGQVLLSGRRHERRR